MADEHLLSASQQRLVLAVVDALNAGVVDLHGHVRAALTPRPAPSDIDVVHRIVSMPWVGYSPGEQPAFILARILDRIEETVADG